MSHVKAKLYGVVAFPALNSEPLFVTDTVGWHPVPAVCRMVPGQRLGRPAGSAAQLNDQRSPPGPPGRAASGAAQRDRQAGEDN